MSTAIRLSTERRARPAGQDPLLLLRPAVRHPAQGARQRGDRLRAVGGVPVQPRHALPQGRQALPAGLHPDRLLDRPPARSRRRPAGFSTMPYDEAIARVASEIERIQETHGRSADRRAQRREPDDREDLPDGQVRPRLPEDAVHRLQRPALHGQRRRGEQEGVRHRPHDQPLVGHGRHRGDLGRRVERRRVLADHDQLHLAGARAWARRSSSRIRASRRSRGPAICSCRSSPAATRRCSPACCT